MPTFRNYLQDYARLVDICSTGSFVTFACKRLEILDYRYRFHELLNKDHELLQQKKHGRDFASTVKVDTHIHLSAAMTENHLLEFIKSKIATDGDRVVLAKGGQKQTLKEIFTSRNINTEKLCLTTLNVKAGTNTFKRFDVFNSLYNPFGESDLRTIFLKTNNYMGGEYYAAIVRQLLDRAEASKTLKTEYRLSVYGRNPKDWAETARWVNSHKLHSPANRWIVQIPRLYNIFRAQNEVHNFEKFLKNLFEPLFENTLDPSSDPELAFLLTQISAFDCVDDETRPDAQIEFNNPTDWVSPHNPPYFFYMYYIYVNIVSLNALRKAKGLNTFDYRPHSGESGSDKHLFAAFLVSKHINHGINLAHVLSLQYLYFVTQIGLAVSPLSNHSLFLPYSENPFPTFLRRGLNVSLSTDDPLQFHSTKCPLLEEYAVAARRWRLSDVDMTEIAYNSITQSGFPQDAKDQWLTKLTSNNARLEFRRCVHHEEIDLIQRLLSSGVFIEPSYNVAHFYSYKTLPEGKTSIAKLKDACQLRQSYIQYAESASWPKVPPVTSPWSLPTSEHIFQMNKGVFCVYESAQVLCNNDETTLANVFCEDCGLPFCEECFRVLHKATRKQKHSWKMIDVAKPLFANVPYETFMQDYNAMVDLTRDGPANTLCNVRLKIMAERFHFYKFLTEVKELEQIKATGTDFYHTIKVDTHIHANRSITAFQLYEFISDKLKNESNSVVWKHFCGEDNVTLHRTFELLRLNPECFTMDDLSVQAGPECYRRYENYVAKYNPFAKPELRDLFLRVLNNDIDGRYLAELMKRYVFDMLDKSAFLKTELRISICGGDLHEFWGVAHWVAKNNLLHPGNRWVIQVPRIYSQYRKEGKVENFAHLLHNIFFPAFEATRNPAAPENRELSEFLANIDAFDSIGDEHDVDLSLSPEDPSVWTKETPPYAYYLYYLYANIAALNHFRALRGLNTFTFRPHCGETGDVSHLAAGFLVANSITHGTKLTSSPALQYLFYLTQIGISSCPMSESIVYNHYENSPFKEFFEKGLFVTLSTDAPLHLHFTDEPILEEYSTASKLWKLNPCDMSEVAWNSVIMSGFSAEEKAAWLGGTREENVLTSKLRMLRNPGEVQDLAKTNVPLVRLQMRADTYAFEMKFLGLE
eukprot:TRINITY_DN7303_c0_g1_i1.p1 TRINITY_DN7303_c0_g1~~TRINITY_DN7303_c0_g1_i1.p1  ORF type:complete len:1282 (-),score=281.16 TRINITY_DN7303_c0_g1_i1:43-3489(-)